MMGPLGRATGVRAGRRKQTPLARRERPTPGQCARLSRWLLADVLGGNCRLGGSRAHEGFARRSVRADEPPQGRIAYAGGAYDGRARNFIVLMDMCGHLMRLRPSAAGKNSSMTRCAYCS